MRVAGCVRSGRSDIPSFAQPAYPLHKVVTVVAEVGGQVKKDLERIALIKRWIDAHVS